MDHLEHKLASLTIILFFALSSGMGQSILAGDTSAAGVIYTDLEDKMISASYPWNTYDADTVDINNDGVDDLRFTAKDDGAGHVSLKSTRMYGFNGTEIVYFEPQVYWVDELQDDAMINAESLWSEGGKLRYQNWYPDTIEEGGVFTWGYAGFRIPAGSGYLYGWVHLSASFTSIFVHDCAYQSMETGIHDRRDEDLIQLYPNPATNWLNILLPDNHEYSDASICDSYGRLLKIFSVTGEEHLSIDVSSLQDGMYILRMTGEATLSRKFLKSTF